MNIPPEPRDKRAFGRQHLPGLQDLVAIMAQRARENWPEGHHHYITAFTKQFSTLNIQAAHDGWVDPEKLECFRAIIDEMELELVDDMGLHQVLNTLRACEALFSWFAGALPWRVLQGELSVRLSSAQQMMSGPRGNA